MSFSIEGTGALTLPSGSTVIVDPATGDRSSLIATMKKFDDEFTALKATNGYTKLPNGLIIQWGWVNVTDDQNVDVTLPIAFPTAFYSAIATPQSTTATTGAGTYSASAFRKNLSTIQVGINIGTSVGMTVAGACWQAIGI